MRKHYLFAPGPTSVPPKSFWSSRSRCCTIASRQFLETLSEVRDGLKYLFQTSGEVILLSASGTGGMEAVVANLFSTGDRALVISGGKFGERWGEICRAYGVEAVTLEVPWGEAVKPGDVAAALARDDSIRGVCVQACETSTGAAHDVRALGEIVKAHPQALLLVDAVSALGATEVRTDEWGLDAVVAGSQKAMMLPPGLAFVAMSDRAWQRAAETNLPRYYFDLPKIRSELEQDDHPYTLPTPVVVALRQSLRAHPCGRTRPHLSAPSTARRGHTRWHQGPGVIVAGGEIPERRPHGRPSSGRDRRRAHPQAVPGAVQYHHRGRAGSLAWQSIPAGAYGLRRYL